MKQSGRLNPSEQTGCPVTSMYGRTPPKKHGRVGRQQQQQCNISINGDDWYKLFEYKVDNFLCQLEN